MSEAMQTMISFAAARQMVLDAVRSLPAETIALKDALGRVLFDPVVSDEMIPPFDNSAMDGFALRARDVRDVAEPGAALPLGETIAAGSGRPSALRKGTCVRIMTGAPLPEGADTVVPVEKAEVSGDRVRFAAAPSPGDHIRRAGENVRAGDRILDAGVRITPPVIGMLATLGYASLRVFGRPRVAVVATGDELVDPSEKPRPSQIRDANGPTLAAQVALAGGIVDGPHRVGDDRERLRQTFDEAAAAADVLVVSGGVSMGEFDYVGAVLEEIGFDPLFWKVRQRPGKPLLFGRIDGLPVFGLPGNPVSASVCFEQYVRPALALMQGRSDVLAPLETAVLDEDVRNKGGLYQFIRGRLRRENGALHAAPTGPQGSHISRSLVLADCFIHLPDDREGASAGSTVTIERLSWG